MSWKGEEISNTLYTFLNNYQGLRLVSNKSKLFYLGKSQGRSTQLYSNFTYIGILVCRVRLNKNDCRTTKEKILLAWKGKQHPYGGRLFFLLKSSLINVLSYKLSMFELPKVPAKIVDLCRKRLTWKDHDDTKKYHLVN